MRGAFVYVLVASSLVIVCGRLPSRFVDVGALFDVDVAALALHLAFQ
jgi:hypothetical protein